MAGRRQKSLKQPGEDVGTLDQGKFQIVLPAGALELVPALHPGHPGTNYLSHVRGYRQWGLAKSTSGSSGTPGLQHFLAAAGEEPIRRKAGIEIIRQRYGRPEALPRCRVVAEQDPTFLGDNDLVEIVATADPELSIDNGPTSRSRRSSLKRDFRLGPGSPKGIDIRTLELKMLHVHRETRRLGLIRVRSIGCRYIGLAAIATICGQAHDAFLPIPGDHL
jgi:hypothetical protein